MKNILAISWFYLITLQKKTMAITRPRFDRQKHSEFLKTLKQRVNQYFDQKKISKYGNWKLFFKTVFMLSLFLIPYFFIVTGYIENYWIIIALWAIIDGSAKLIFWFCNSDLAVSTACTIPL